MAAVPIRSSTLLKQAGTDRLNALYTAIDLVRRGGTISLSGVYGGAADPLGVESFASHTLPLEHAPEAYAKFQTKDDGLFKVLLKP